MENNPIRILKSFKQYINNGYYYIVVFLQCGNIYTTILKRTMEKKYINKRGKVYK